MTDTPWSWEDAQAWIRQASDAVYALGFVCAVFGSVPRSGIGRDLDVLLVRIRGKAPFRDALHAILHATGNGVCDGTVDATGAHVAVDAARWVDLTYAAPALDKPSR